MRNSSISTSLLRYTALVACVLALGFTAVSVYSQVEPPEAYFIVEFPPSTDTFVIKITNPQRIQEARDIIASNARKIVNGAIIKQPVYYNSPWSYHLDPKSIGFVEFAVELCDASPRYLEQNLNVAYPDWCPWTSRLLREIPRPPKPGTENIKPNISMSAPYADNVYFSSAPGNVILGANAADVDGTITKVQFKNGGNVIGETTTYPYRFDWQNLSAGQYTVTATATDNEGASTTSRSVTFLITGGPPRLLTDTDGSTAAVFDSVLLSKEPFAVISEHPFGADQRTRLILFGINLELRPGETVSAITAQAEDLQQRNYVLAVENVRVIPAFFWLTQVTVRLPDELQGIGDVRLSVSLRGVQSNKVSVRIR